jgi:hypothetical protein
MTVFQTAIRIATYEARLLQQKQAELKSRRANSDDAASGGNCAPERIILKGEHFSEAIKNLREFQQRQKV